MIDLCVPDGLDWCDCEKCMELDKPLVKAIRCPEVGFNRSNSHVIFQNEVLNRVNKAFPDVKFGHECYTQYMETPRVSLTNLNDNLLSMFCFYVRCASHAICDKDCKLNQTQFYANIEGWAKWHGNKKRVIPFDLNCGMAGQAQMPLPMLNTSVKDFPYYKSFGGTVIWYSGAVYSLNAYVAMRLAWNVDEKPDKILADYFNDYYGKAGNLMRAYFMGWEDAAQRLNNSGKHWFQGWRRIALYVDEEDLKKFEDIIIQAGKIPESAEIKTRIKQVESHFYYIKNVWLATKKLDAVERYEKAGNTEEAGKAKEELLKLCDKITGSKCGDRVAQQLYPAAEKLSSKKPVNMNNFNGGFEYGFSSWSTTAMPSVFERQMRGIIDTNEFHSGKQCLKFANSVPEDVSEINQVVEFNQKEPRPIRISGWNKVKETIQGSGRFCIYVDFTYEDGAPLCAQKVEFDREPHDWQYGEKIINPAKPVKSAKVCVFLENNIGTTWFDDIGVTEVMGEK